MKPYQHGYGAEARSVQAPKMSHTEREEHQREGMFLMNTAAKKDPPDQILFTTRKVN